MTLSKLEHQLHLLTQPRHLDSISRRVKVLVGDLERVHEARRKLGDTRPLNVALGSGITVSAPGSGGSSASPTSASATAGASGAQTTGGQGGGGASSAGTRLPPDALQKIDALFALLPRLDPLLPLAPHLLNRLKSLASLHTASSTFASDLTSLGSEADRLKEAHSGLEDVLKNVEASLETNEKTVKTNLEALEGRVKDLMRRLDALTSTSDSGSGR
jgi:nuclear migration protein JNM1